MKLFFLCLLLTIVLITPLTAAPAETETITHCPHIIPILRENDQKVNKYIGTKDILYQNGWYYTVILWDMLQDKGWAQQYRTDTAAQIQVFTKTWKPVWNGPLIPINYQVTRSHLPAKVPKSLDPAIFPRLLPGKEDGPCPFWLGFNWYLLCVDADLKPVHNKTFELPFTARDYLQVNDRIFALGEFQGKFIHELALPSQKIIHSFLSKKELVERLEITNKDWGIDSGLVGIAPDGNKGFFCNLRPLAVVVFQWNTGKILSVQPIPTEALPPTARTFHNVYWSSFDILGKRLRAWLVLQDYMTFQEFQKEYPRAARRMAQRWLKNKGRLPEFNRILKMPKVMGLAINIQLNGRLAGWAIMKIPEKTPDGTVFFSPPFSHVRLPAPKERFGWVSIHSTDGPSIRRRVALCRW